MRNLVIVVVLSIIFLFVFPGKKETYKSADIPEGFIYEAKSSSKTVSPNIGVYEASEGIKEKSVLKKYQAYFDFGLPDEFIVVKNENKGLSDFVIISTSAADAAGRLAEKIEVAEKHPGKRQVQKPVLSQVYQKKQGEGSLGDDMLQGVKKEAKYDYNTYNNIIKNSRKTFFFPDNFKNISDVSAGVISITPYEDKHIVKFQVQNKSSGYFFIANTALYKGSDFVICDYYNDSMVAGGRTLDGIIVAPQFQSKHKVTFKMLESAGKNRVYEIIINIP